MIRTTRTDMTREAPTDSVCALISNLGLLAGCSPVRIPVLFMILSNPGVTSA